MKKFVLSGLCCASLVALLPETGRAHGGQYRGPADVVPPAPGGGGGRTGGPSGPTTGGPSGPSAPGPSGPSTGGPGGPTTGGPSGGGGGRSGPTTGGRGYEVSDDLNEWLYWWEFNKDPFIRLKDAVQQSGAVTGSDDYYLGSTRRNDARDSLKPTSEQIQGEILPALKKAIDSTDQPDINSSCMVAMAKIGTDHTEFKLRDVFTPRLKKNNQELRETAALSVGIAAIGAEEDVEMLVNLALDNDKGRSFTGGGVDNRTRSFAMYGLGLTAHKHSNPEIKRKAFEAMKTVLADKRIGDRNIKVAAINGISILNIGNSGEADKALMGDALKALEAYYNENLGAGEQLIQAHVPTAVAKLIGREHEQSETWRARFAADLEGKGPVKRESNEIAQSCAMALGVMARPYDDEKKSPDAKYSKLLLQVWGNHKNPQARNYAMLGLGQIGGAENYSVMLKEFDGAKKELGKPWCSLALGVFSFYRNEANQKSGTSDRDKQVEFIGETLFQEFKDAKTPSLTGSLAIGLGLSKYTPAADEMRKRLLDNLPKEQMAGYLCIGLALMGDNTSKKDLQDVVQKSVRRTDLLPQAAIALGKLGDKTVAETLQKLMTDGEPNLAKLSAIAGALGFIGDARTIKPLKDLLFDEKLQELSRAFAAVALGGVADKEPLPWNSKIGQNINYRAAVETLTNGTSGILDIL